MVSVKYIAIMTMKQEGMIKGVDVLAFRCKFLNRSGMATLCTNLRNCQAWRDEGLSLTTPSNEAAKLFDAALRQMLSWRDDEAFGGLSQTCEKILSADPHFIMGKVLVLGLELLSTRRTIRFDKKLVEQLSDLAALVTADKSLTRRERLHVDAVQLWSEGQLPEACEKWEEILVDWSTDLLAIKFAHDTYFFLGEKEQIRDSMARVLSDWKPHQPLYSYLKGLYAFGLEETNLYEKAEKEGMEALVLNKNDAWSAHAVAHVHEMTGQVVKGIQFLQSRVDDWNVCNMIACHNYWHLCLHFIENGEYEAALTLLDEQILKYTRSGNMLDMVDAVSVLQRLQLEGIAVGTERWRAICDIYRQNMDDHVLMFNDCHLLMAFLGCQQNENVQRHLESLREFASDQLSPSRNCKLTRRFGCAMAEAIVAFDRGDFAQTVDQLAPIRSKIVKIGGSNAQRDVFEQILLHAAIRSSKPEHTRLARHLLSERKAKKPQSGLTDRLVEKFFAYHEEEPIVNFYC